MHSGKRLLAGNVAGNSGAMLSKLRHFVRKFLRFEPSLGTNSHDVRLVMTGTVFEPLIPRDSLGRALASRNRVSALLGAALVVTAHSPNT
jgi:hypothetical protein